ncbi:MAG: hypothetical protein ABI443_07800 [Chthoniobacterales bacterium]
MKLILISFLAILAAASLQAQDPAVKPADGFTAPKKKVVKTTIIKPSVNMQGIVAQIFRSPTPLQMINPLAPKEYGSGDQNISRGLNDPGKPEGFIIFGFQY